MRSAEVYVNHVLAGVLTENSKQSFVFEYNMQYFNDDTKKAISLTLPKTKIRYESRILFPFFYNMLSEGVNRKLQSTLLKIDENDHFGFLLATAKNDTIGAVTIKTREER